MPNTRLAALDFRRDIKCLTEDFTGREWLFDAIDDWLHKQEQRFFILTGEPGVGKSAIAARLTQVQPDNIAAYHFCMAGNIGTITPNTVLRSLAAQLGKSFPDYGKALANTIKPSMVSVNVKQVIGRVKAKAKVVGVDINSLTSSNPEEELDILLRAPLTALKPPDTPVFILIDSLDEAITYQHHQHQINLVTLLAKTNGLPSWVRFLCTTRPAEVVLSHFNLFKPYTLAAESQMNLKDIGRYIDYKMGKAKMQTQLQAANVVPQDLAGRVAGLADGNFLYTKVLLNDIEAGRQPLHNLATLPHSLDEIYHGFLRRFSDADWDKNCQPILGKLAVAQEPITQEQLANFTGLPRRQVRRSLAVVGQYLNIIKGAKGSITYRLFHQSLRDYLLAEDRSALFWCDPEEEHDIIARFYLQRYQRNWLDCDVYGLRHLARHAAAVKLLDTLVTDNLFLVAAEPTLLLRVLPLVTATNARAARHVYELVVHNLITAQAATRASYLQLAGRQSEMNHMADQLASLPLRLPWTVPWARWQSLGAHRILARYQNEMPLGVAIGEVNDKTVAIIGRTDNIVEVRDLANDGLLHTFESHHWGGVDTVVTSAIGSRPIAVTGGGGGTVRVWDLASGSLLRTFEAYTEATKARMLEGYEQPVRTIAIGTMGSELVAASGGSDGARVWDATDGTLLRVFTNCDVRAITVGAIDEQSVILCGEGDGTVRVWNLASGSLRHTLEGHEHWVEALAVGTIDSQPVAISGGHDGTVRVWDLASGSLRHTLEGHRGEVTAVVVGMLGTQQIIITGGADGTVRVWDLADGVLLRSLAGHRNRVEAVAVGALGEKAVALSSGWDRTVRVWDLTEINALSPGDGSQGEINAVAVGTMNGQPVVLSGGSDGSVHLCDLAQGSLLRVFRGHRGVVWAMAIGMLGTQRVIISGGLEGIVRVWDCTHGSLLRTLEDRQRVVRAVAVSTIDGQPLLVTGGSDGEVHVWDLLSGALLRTSTGHQGHIGAVTVGTVGMQPVIVTGGHDGTVRVWALTAGSLLHTLEGHRGEVAAVGVGMVGTQPVIISGGHDGTVRIWDLTAGSLLRTLRGHRKAIQAVAIGTADARLVAATGGADGTVRVWDLTSGRRLRTLKGHRGGVRAVALGTVDMQPAIVSGGDDGTVRVWNVSSGTLMHTLEGLHGPIRAVAMDADSIAVSGGDDGTIRMWDLSQGTRLRTLEGPPQAVRAVATGGEFIAVSGGDDGTVRVWDLLQGSLLHTLIGFQGHIRAVAVGMAGSQPLIVSAGDNGTIRVWNLTDGAPLYRSKLHNQEVAAVTAGTLAGQPFAVSGGSDERVRIWHLATGTLVRTLGGFQRAVGARLSLIERAKHVASYSQENPDVEVDIWDTGEGAPLCTLLSYQGTVQAVAMGEIDGHAIIVFSGKHSERIDSPEPHSETRGRVFVYDLTSESFLHILEGHEGEVQAVAMGTLGGQCIIVSGGDDAMVRIWNFADGAELATIDIGARITSLALVSSTLVVGSAKGVLCVNLAATL